MREQIHEWQEVARATLEPAAFDYFAGGAGDELSLGEATSAWDDWRFVPKVLRDVARIDTSSKLLGAALQSPIVVAPTAYHAIAHEQGELASAAGARDAGALYVMATRATHPLEDVAAVAGDPWWFQVYVLRDRGLTRALVERAVAAGAAALMLTGDTPIIGRSRRASGPVPLSDEQYLVNLGLHLAEASGTAVETATTQDPSITEEAISWLADLSGLPVLVKGVLSEDDALRCVQAGAAGLVVSNHGARQLDGARATAHALPAITRAIDERVPVLVDGGLRDGRAILKALCLGASAVMIGRPVVWALAAGGAPAVTQLLEGLRLELVESMTLAGAPAIADCDRSLVEWRWSGTKGGAPG